MFPPLSVTQLCALGAVTCIGRRGRISFLVELLNKSVNMIIQEPQSGLYIDKALVSDNLAEPNEDVNYRTKLLSKSFP